MLLAVAVVFITQSLVQGVQEEVVMAVSEMRIQGKPLQL
jgi:hypothetical protein